MIHLVPLINPIRVHGISRSADGANQIRRSIDHISRLADDCNCDCREQTGCWITPAAGTRRQQIAWYAGTHNSGGGGAREAGRDFARQTGKGRQKKFLWAFFLYFVKSKIANYWRWALFLLGI